MAKKNIEISDDTQHLFPNLQSYSIDEIMAAGGTTAFANKSGKNAQSLVDRLNNIPKDTFLTDEDIDNALKILKSSK